jgi:hypothetical protein
VNVEEGIRRGYELFNRREWDRLARGFPEDFEAIDRVPPDARHALGPGALREITEANGDNAFADLRMEATEVRVAVLDDGLTHAVVRVHAAGSGGASGAPVQGEVGQFWAFEGDRAIRMEQFRTWDEALAAAGLPA